MPTDKLSRWIVNVCALVTVTIALWNGGKPWGRWEIFFGGLIVGFLIVVIIMGLADWHHKRKEGKVPK